MILNLQQATQENSDNVQPEQAKHTQNKLPFLVEEQSIKEWLDLAEVKQPVQATNEIYNVLKILLRNHSKHPKHLEIILPLITPVIIQLCQQLEHLFCTPAKNIDDKKRKIARLSINSLRYLAILYQKQSSAIDTNIHLALNYNNCLQISYLCLKQSALIYERPSTELWKVIGIIYQSAIDKLLLDLTCKNSIAVNKQHNSITDNIKSILLFSLCKPYHLNQLDILSLCDLLDQHHDKLILSDQHSTSSSHSWNYRSSQTVQVIIPNSHPGLNTLFLDSHLLVQPLMTEKYCSIAELLTSSQSLIPQLAIAQPNKKQVSIGITSIISTLEQHRQSENINNTSVRELSISDQFELQPVGYRDKKPADTPSHKALQFDSTPDLLTEAIVKESAEIDFALIELAPFPCHAEDLIVILNDSPQLSIIRNLTILTNNHYQLLAEKISSEIQVVVLTYQNSERKALLCKIYDNLTFILLAPDKYTTGSPIQIDKQTFNLIRLYESTAYFMLFQVQTH